MQVLKRIAMSSLSLDDLLKPDKIPDDVDEIQPTDYWRVASRIRHINPVTFIPREVVSDEVLTRRNADAGRPHPILDRPDPEPDSDDEDLFNDPGTWQFRQELRECEMCGEPFLANAHNHRFCSPDCSFKGRIHVRACPICGKVFASERNGQVFCSVACAGYAKRNPDNDRLCHECGEPFRATRKAQTFCSRVCARVFQKRERMRECW